MPENKYGPNSNSNQTSYGITHAVLKGLTVFQKMPTKYNNTADKEAEKAYYQRIYDSAKSNIAQTALLKNPSFIEATSGYHCYVELPIDKTSSALQKLLREFAKPCEENSPVVIPLPTLTLAIKFKKIMIKRGFEVDGPSLDDLENQKPEQSNENSQFIFEVSAEDYQALLRNERRITYYQAIVDLHTSVIKKISVTNVIKKYQKIKIKTASAFFNDELLTGCHLYLRALSGSFRDEFNSFLMDYDIKIGRRYSSLKTNLIHELVRIDRETHILSSFYSSIEDDFPKETTDLVKILLKKAEVIKSEIKMAMKHDNQNINYCEYYIEGMRKMPADDPKISQLARFLWVKTEEINQQFTLNDTKLNDIQKEFEEKVDLLNRSIQSLTSHQRTQTSMTTDRHQILHDAFSKAAAEFSNIKTIFENIGKKLVNLKIELCDLQTQLKERLDDDAYAPLEYLIDLYETQLDQEMKSYSDNIRTSQEYITTTEQYQKQLENLKSNKNNQNSATVVKALIDKQTSQSKNAETTPTLENPLDHGL